MKLQNRLKKILKKLKIIVPYKKSLYKINIVDGIFIFHQIIWLLVRRGLRLLKRVFSRSLNIVVVVICGILFSLLVIPLGISIDKYNTWYDGLWDLRTFILTSVLIVFVNNNISEEKGRNEALQKQYFTYHSFMFDTEKYIEDLLDAAGCSYQVSSIFLTENKLELFKRELAVLPCSEFALNRHSFNHIEINLVSLNKKQINYLSNLLNYINVTDKLVFNKNSCRQWILEAINTIENENLKIKNYENHYEPDDIKNFINKCLVDYIYIIAELRRPWRWDHHRNMKIREKLLYKGKIVKGIDGSNSYWF